MIKGKVSEEGKGRAEEGREKGQKVSVKWCQRSRLRTYELNLTSVTFSALRLWFSLSETLKQKLPLILSHSHLFSSSCFQINISKTTLCKFLIPKVF